MSGATLDPAGPPWDSRTRLSRSVDGLSSAIPLPLKVPYAVRTPQYEYCGLGSSAFARRYLRNHCYFLFLRLLRCFSSPGSLRTIRGSMLMCSSPRLFAAYRVFHRLPVPGHPPCALLCLTSCTSGPHQLKLFQSGSPVVLTCSYRRICKACPSCSLVLLAIAFSIYISCH